MKIGLIVDLLEMMTLLHHAVPISGNGDFIWSVAGPQAIGEGASTVSTPVSEISTSSRELGHQA